MKVLIFIIFFAFLFLINSVIINAQEISSQASESAIKIDRISNIRDRLFEKISFFFKFSKEQKIDYLIYLQEKRLADLKYAIDNDQGDLIEELSSRYSTYLGKMANFMSEKKLSYKKEEVLKMMERHKIIIETLHKNFEFESGFWILLQHDINTLKIFSDKIKQI